MNSVTYRKQQVERRRQQQQRKNMVSLVIGVVGVLHLAAVLFFQIELSSPLLFALLLLCPLSHLFMLGGHGHGEQQATPHSHEEHGHG